MDNAAHPVLEEVLAGGGEMGVLMRSLAWSATPLGPVEHWPQSLRTSVSICLASRFPILIWWGPELVKLYNDAYAPILGDKHPRAMGAPGREIWPEIWDIIGPMLGGVMERGQATWSEDQMLPLRRRGFVEECYFTFSYSPIADESGGVGGVFTAVTETTGRVVGERRLRTLRDLAERAADARTAEEACAAAAATLAKAAADIPFALLYLLDKEGVAQLTATSGLAPDTAASPRIVGTRADEPGDAAAGGWPVARVAHTGRPEVVDQLRARFGPWPGGPWPESPDRALVLPIAQAGAEGPAGVLVAGLSPRLELDEAYRSFLELVAGQVATAVADARAYEAERERAEALAELDRAKTAFFSNVSHEFRTPLTLLLGPLEDLLRAPEGELSPAQRGQAELMQRNGLRLLKLVNTLLDFSRIEAGRVQAVYEPTDLAAYTVELAGVLRSAIEQAGLRLVVDCPPLPEPVYVDHEMWEKIVLNLLSNAFKFTFAGEIAIALRPATRGAAVELVVRDTGTGIPPEELPHLFERFHRVRNARARTLEGTGIGLALVQELVRLHGGSVRVDSVVDQGTTFVVSIPQGTAHLPAERIGGPRAQAPPALGATPYVQEALRWLPSAEDGLLDGQAGLVLPRESAALADSAAPAPPPPAAPAPRARVLVADDNADMRAYVTRLLADRWDVQAVGDGASALAVARADPPDLVLADVMIPGLDGFELLRALRADPRTRELPVVLLSARAGEEAKVEGLEQGANDYLVKPFTARELLARVQAHVELARLRRAEQSARAEAAAERERLLVAERAARAQAERERTEKQLLLDASNEGIYGIDAQGRCTYINQAALALLGYTAAECLGQNLHELIHSKRPDGSPYPLAECPIYRALTTGQGARLIEEALWRKDGTPLPVLYSCAPVVEAGRVVGTVVTIIDTSERREAEAALRASQGQLQMARMMAWEWDPVRDVLTTTDNFVDVFGRPPIGRAAEGFALIHPEDRLRHRAAVQNAVASGGSYIVEYRIIRPDTGVLAWLEERATAVLAPDGTVHKIAGVVLDISRRKRAEEAERARTEQLRALSQAALALTAAPSLDERLAIITERAHAVIGAHQAVTSLTRGADWSQAISVVSFSDKYAAWRAHAPAPDGSGLSAEVCRLNRPVRMTQAELEAHPAWPGLFGPEADKRPPLRGWLAAPLVAQDGSNLGLIQLSDKERGEFTAEDEAILVQLAQMASVAIENAHLFEAERAARADAEAAVHRTTRLQAVTEALATSLTIDEVARVVVQEGVTALGATAGHMYLLDPSGETLELAGDAYYPAAILAPFRRLPVSMAGPDRDAVRTGQAIWLEAKADWERRYPELAPLHAQTGYQAAVAVPLPGRERVEGVIGLSFVGARVFGTEDRALLLTLGRQAAQALERARFYEAERVARAAAEIAQQRAEQLAERLQLAQAVGRIGTYEWDVEAGTVTWTPEMEQLYGLSPGGFSGRYEDYLQAIHPEDRERVEREGLAATAAGADLNIQFRIIWPDGTVRHLLATARTIRGSDGRKRVIGVNVDVTEREEALAAAQEAVRARDEFLSIASHELRTPVTSLKGTAQLLLRQQARGRLDPERLQRSLTMLNQAADRLARLTEDLLDVSRIRTGHLALRPQLSDLVALVREAVARAQEQVSDSHRFGLDAPEPVAPLWLDAMRIDQVLTNLVDNAVKYSPAGGEIAVSVRPDGAGVRVSLRDRGIGLPPEAREGIFEPFGRALNAAKSHLPGMGLGLYICRNIVERHGGRIWAESPGEGQGTTFSVWLPRAPVAVEREIPHG